MSHLALPWYRSYSRLLREAEYQAMPAAWQAAYRNLLDYANEQTERGTFRLDDLDALANIVASGDTTTLCALLDYCTTTWQRGSVDGLFTIAVERGVGRFTAWAILQQPRSTEPAAQAARQRQHRARQPAGNPPAPSASGRLSSNGASALPAPALRSEPEQVLDILASSTWQPPTSSTAACQRIAAIIERSPQVDPILSAYEYVDWQKRLLNQQVAGASATTRRVHKDWIAGWGRSMCQAREKGWEQRSQPDAGVRPFRKPGQWRYLETPLPRVGEPHFDALIEWIGDGRPDGHRGPNDARRYTAIDLVAADEQRRVLTVRRRSGPATDEFSAGLATLLAEAGCDDWELVVLDGVEALAALLL